MPDSSSSSSVLMAAPSLPLFRFFGGGRALVVFGFDFTLLVASGWLGFFGVMASGACDSVFFAASGASLPVMAVTSVGLYKLGHSCDCFNWKILLMTC